MARSRKKAKRTPIKRRGPTKRYNRLGKRIAALDDRHPDLGRVLGISQLLLRGLEAAEGQDQAEAAEGTPAAGRR